MTNRFACAAIASLTLLLTGCVGHGRIASPAATTITVPGGDVDWALGQRSPVDAPLVGSAGFDSPARSASVESVIKVWLAADYLRINANPDPATVARIADMISASNDTTAQDLFITLGGDETIHRAVVICGLRHVETVTGWWSKTRLTAADLARLGLCVAAGKVAGPQWTPWLLAVMAQPHTAGAFGVRDTLAGQSLAYMNGWTDYDGSWHVNCLAVGATWVLAVTTHYPSARGLTFGAGVCAGVARQLLGQGRLPA